jgi:hypothetical protein
MEATHICDPIISSFTPFWVLQCHTRARRRRRPGRARAGRGVAWQAGRQASERGVAVLIFSTH